jgi:hypothetical protein
MVVCKQGWQVSIVEVNKLDDVDLFPIIKGEEPQAKHFAAIRERMWVLDHPSAGSIDTTIMFGKWVGDATTFQYVDYNYSNWHWLPDAKFHPGDPTVKFRWGPNVNDVDIFIFMGTTKGVVLNANPPVVGGQINSLWKLGVDPNKYSHWNKGAGRPDIKADDRWIFQHHGWTEQDGWEFGIWEAWKEYPIHTDPFEQVPHIKWSGGQKARHRPVEKDKDDITQVMYTLFARQYQDGYIGTEPNLTPWWHKFQPNRISEYTPGDSNPIDSIQVGPNIDYRDIGFNAAYQDRIKHLIEHNFWYVREVDDFFIKRWQHWNMYGTEIEQVTPSTAGCPNTHPNYCTGKLVWTEYNPPYGMYYEGDSVIHLGTGYFYRCIQDMPPPTYEVEPGVDAGWEDYWIQDTLYQPNFIFTDPYFVQYSDYLHCCNSSAFEKVLKDIGKFDWYWDPNATMPWWMYQQHYWLMTQHLAEPANGHDIEAIRRYPKPRGCWRRVWRYTQNWDERRDPTTGKYYRTQLSRFGKEIDIDGKMVSMMWPGELGNPPGYDLQLTYHSYEGGLNYNMWYYRHIIDQATYDFMERPASWSWQYTQHYVVVDVEELFRQAYRARPNVELRIAERHDPLTTQWTQKLNPVTKLTEWMEEPIFELYADMINDMRDAIAELKYLRKESSKSVTQEYYYIQENQFGDPLAAYEAGKTNTLYNEYSLTQFGVGLEGFVCWYSEAHIQYGPWDVTLPGQSMHKSLGRVKIWTADYDFPASLSAIAMIRVKYRCYGFFSLFHIVDDIKLGFGDLILEDARRPKSGEGQLPWKCAYLPLGTPNFDWVYNATDQVWEFQWECKTELLESWPPDEYFKDPYSDAEWRMWTKKLELDFVVDDDLIFKLDFDKYLESVFRQDPTNLLEVT